MTSEERRALQRLAQLWLSKWERTVIGELQRYFRLQRADVLAALKRKDATKALDVGALVSRTKWDRQLSDLMSGVYSQLYEQVGEGLFTTFDVGTAFNLHDPAVTESLARRVNKIVGVNRTTEDSIRQTLIEGDQQGESIVSLAARVNAVFDTASRSRAVTIARTEVVGANNEANYLSAVQSELQLIKVWMSTEDDRTRDSHVDADGQEAALDEPFTVGDSELLYPHDPDGDAGEVINCRCVLIYNVDGGDQATASPGDADTPPDVPTADDLGE